MLTARRVEPSDRGLLEAAADADKFHSLSGLKGDHWFEDSILYSDETGPVVALKTTQVVRVDIQFVTQDRLRNAKALLEGFWRYVEVMRKRDVKEIIFNTKSSNVMRFFQKHFHFRQIGPETFSLRINR